MNSDFEIRLIEQTDAQATLNIYAPYVQQTAVSFEYEVPTIQEWEKRIETYSNDCPWLVCEQQGKVVGYAYAGKHRSRVAYAWSAELAVYILEQFHGFGIAAALYKTLFDLLRLQGYVNALAGVTIPNAKSENFHLKMGFEDVGIYKNVGYKIGDWHSTRWFQLALQPHEKEPKKPRSFSEIQQTSEVATVLQTGNAILSKTTNKGAAS
jgi:phosphinothricin acetyltransferase